MPAYQDQMMLHWGPREPYLGLRRLCWQLWKPYHVLGGPYWELYWEIVEQYQGFNEPYWELREPYWGTRELYWGFREP